MEAEQEKSGVIIVDLDNSSSDTSGNDSGATKSPGAILHHYSDFSVGDSSSSSPSLSASSSSYFNKQRLVAPFVRKTYDMVKNPNTNSIISWNSDGSHMIVWDAHKFASEILPTYFRHNNFSSFVCQLNKYGFKKVDWDKWEFQHQWFQRGKKSWLKKIKIRITRSSPIPLQEQQHQLPHDEEMSAVKVGEEIKEMLEEQNAMGMEIKQLQEQQVILTKELAVIKKQAETPDVKGRKLFLLMAQDFLENKRALQSNEVGEWKKRDENNTKGKSPVEEELSNAIQERERNNVLAGSETHTRLEKVVEEGVDIMIGLEDLIEGPADWEDYVKKLEEKGADLKTKP